MNASQEWMIAKIDAWLEEMKAGQKETMACWEMMEACLGSKASHEGIEAVAKHQEVPKEEGIVETIGALEDQYGDQHLAVGRHQQPKKQTQGDGGSWKKLAAAQGWLTCGTVPAPHKGCCRQGPGNNGIRDQGLT
jgi:hypothetical protein